MRFSFACTVVAAVSTLLGSRLTAQTVQGILIGEKSLAPIGNAQLALVDDSGRVASTTVTDSGTGTFYLDAPRAGRYQLRFLIGHGGLSHSPMFTVDSNQTLERKFAVPDWPREVLEAYLQDSVTKRAAFAPGNRSPRYPDALRAAHRNGVVRAMFVVDRDGHPVASTLRIIESDDDAFSRALQDWFETTRFIAAEREGVKVPQVFEAGIDFGFGTEPARLSGNNVIIVRALGYIRTR